MVKIEQVNPGQVIPAIRELMRANWNETGFDFEFDPDAQRYEFLYTAGLMFALVAYDGDRIVGYCTVLVGPHLHNRAVVVASHDALFVDPSFRGLVSGRLMRAAEVEAKRRGAVRFLWHTRAGTGLSEVLQRRGYAPADTVVMKGL